MMEEKSDKAYLRELAHKWKTGKLSKQEKEYLQNWEDSHQDDILDLPDHSGGAEAVKSRMYAQLAVAMKGKDSPKNNFISIWLRIGAAASLLFFLSVGAYFTFHNKPVQKNVQNLKQVIKPGNSQATLTLASGKKIVLTKKLSGLLAVQANASIQVNAQNSILYKPTVNGSSAKVEYNTLTTQKGEQSPYPLELADGTKVWLNAASSIKFPTAFTGTDRVVNITGEVYFEVAKDRTRPFKVISSRQQIEVLGTHFNVNTYDDDASTKTTLLEGSVKIRQLQGNQTDNYKILKPNQQSVLKESGIKIKEVDTEDAVAWKNGYFVFEDDNLEAIMHKLERWYDVRVDYQGDFQKNKNKVIGTISRSAPLQEVLKMLESTGEFKFKCEGRRVTVIK